MGYIAILDHLRVTVKTNRAILWMNTVCYKCMSLVGDIWCIIGLW